VAHCGPTQSKVIMTILVFYGSYRSDRMGIRLAHFVVGGLRARGNEAELIDAQAIGLPMLDRMYKEYPKGQAPAALETLAGKIRDADGFVFIAGEYNWGIQPGLKNLTDHFLEEWFWRPAAIASYSAGRFSGARGAGLARHAERDGHGGDLQHAFGRSDRADAVRSRRGDPRGRQGAFAGISAVRRRPRMVDRGGTGAAREKAAAVLRWIRGSSPHMTRGGCGEKRKAE
jgi:NAD(P)H-dependent FMN reductase